MPYGTITLLSDLISTSPADAEAANLLASAERQVRQFLGTYLAVSHNDDGTLKQAAVSAALAAQTFQPAVDSVDTPMIVDGAVVADKLATNAVTTDKIAAGAVTTAKLADGAVTDVKVTAVSGTKVSDNTLSSDKLSGDTVNTTIAGKMGNGTLDAKVLKVGTVEPMVPVVMLNAANNVLAQIPGASLDVLPTPPQLILPGFDGAGALGVFTINSFGDQTYVTGTGGYNHYDWTAKWTRVRGSTGRYVIPVDELSVELPQGGVCAIKAEVPNVYTGVGFSVDYIHSEALGLIINNQRANASHPDYIMTWGDFAIFVLSANAVIEFKIVWYTADPASANGKLVIITL
jgi:hypothetical protein